MSDAPDIDAVLGEDHQAPLDADSIPNANQSHTCFSCNEPLNALYCGSCGQKNDDFRRPLWQLGQEAIVSLTAIENKIWRTWGNLFARPGRVAREYADGRRTHWSSPVRVYIFMSIALFFFMEITGTLFFALEGKLTPKEGVDTPRAEWTVDDVNWGMEVHAFATQDQSDGWNESLDFDLFTKAFAQDSDTFIETFDDDIVDAIANDALSDEDLVNDLFDDIDRPLSSEERDGISEGLQSLRDAAVSARGTPGEAVINDLIARIEAEADARTPSLESDDTSADPAPALGVDATIGEDGRPDTISINGREVGNISTFVKDLIAQPELVNNALNRWLPRIIFLMMPLTMLIGAMFIRGLPRRAKRKGCPRGERHALLYDHLVHATYIHAFAYALLFFGIIVSRVLPGSGIHVAQVIFVAMLIYLPISLRRMFRRGWFKTIWTAYGVALIHFIIVISLVTWAVANSLQDYFAT